MTSIRPRKILLGWRVANHIGNFPPGGGDKKGFVMRVNLFFVGLVSFFGFFGSNLDHGQVALGTSLQASVLVTSSDKSQFQMGSARFTIITPSLIRIEYAKNQEFLNSPTFFAVNRETRSSATAAIAGTNTLVIETEFFRLRYREDGQKFHAGNLEASIKKGSDEVLWHYGDPNSGNLGGTRYSLDNAVGPEALKEGLFSRDGWFLLDDSKSLVLTQDWIQNRPPRELDSFLFAYGNDFQRALKDLTAIGGRVPIPRKTTLGVWYSRFWAYTSTDYKNIVNEFQSKDFPLDIMVLDMLWHKEGWTGYSWNRNLLPDAEDLLKWFREKNLVVTLNDHPGPIASHEDMFGDYMSSLGLSLSQKPPEFDPFSKSMLNKLFQFAHSARDRDGVDFWWMDYFDEPTLGQLNKYYFEHTSQNGKRGQVLSRWGGWGDHRHPMQFSGDTDTDFEMLKFVIPFTSKAASVGAWYWSHDIGGHKGPRNEEAVTRWMQFGALSASMRLHSNYDDQLDRRPWLYEPKYTTAMKSALFLRSSLMPYIYSTTWQGYADSKPMIRPLYLEHPEFEESYNHAQEYFFGDHLIAAPITDAGKGDRHLAQQSVWIPPGQWADWDTHEVFVGPQSLVVEKDINHIPLFIRVGVIVPMQPVTLRMGSEPTRNLVLKAIKGKNNSSATTQLYEDDGLTNQYIEGKHSITYLSSYWYEDHMDMLVSSRDGHFDGELLERKLSLQINGVKSVSTVRLNGQEVPFKFDQATQTLTAESTNLSTNEYHHFQVIY